MMGEDVCPSLDAAIRKTAVRGGTRAAPNAVDRSRSTRSRRPAASVAAFVVGMGTSSLV
jgi:hypothetical protein